jgi:lipoyl(octanoyl) transferase
LLQKQLFVLREEKKSGDALLFTEHFPVYTFGKSGEADHLLASEAELRSGGVEVFNIDRGGDVTFHGPGQLVGYPILDLNDYYLDLHRYLRDIEEVLIRTLADFGILGSRDPEFTGVWVNGNKIAAIGVKASRWITMHGFALNVNTDLKYFERIIPCGIFHKGVTSMQQELGLEIPLADVKEKLAAHFGEVFDAEMINAETEVSGLSQL